MAVFTSTGISAFIFFTYLIPLAICLDNPSSSSEPVTEIIDLDDYPSDNDQNETSQPTVPTTKATPATVSGHSGAPYFPRDPSLLFCSCDLTSNLCDINCCCDADCTEEQKQVFSSCIAVGPRYGPWNQQCHETRHFFRDNSYAPRTETQSDSYFCLVYDNLNERHFYESPAILESESDVDKAIGSDSSYSWSTRDEILPARGLGKKAGDVVKMVRKQRNVIMPWSLPCAPLSSWCCGFCPVRYLSDRSWSCLRQPHLLASACNRNGFLSAQIYHQGFQILKSSNHSSNSTNICTKNNCVAVTLVGGRLCSGKHCTPGSYEMSAPVLGSNGICKNAVVSVIINIEHSGAAGINSVKVSFQTAAINVSVPHLQHFRVKYKWTNASDEAFHRSGSPGYAAGLPLLVGSKRIFTNNQSYVIQGIKGLTAIGVKVDGSCDEDSGNRVAVNFKQNLRTGCNLQLPLPSNHSCHYLRCFLQDLLVDSRIDHMASFGDPASNHDWIKIQIVNRIVSEADVVQKSTCWNVPNHLEVQVVYAATHTVRSPQFKVIGTKFVFHNAPAVMLQRASEKSSMYVVSVPVSTSVSFHRVQQTPQRQFGRPPQIKVHVPSDFFYPFLMGSADPCAFIPFYLLVWTSIYLFINSFSCL